jgi:hypothetical protein
VPALQKALQHWVSLMHELPRPKQPTSPPLHTPLLQLPLQHAADD